MYIKNEELKTKGILKVVPVLNESLFLECAHLVFRRYAQENLIQSAVVNQLGPTPYMSRPAVCYERGAVYALTQDDELIATATAVLAENKKDAEFLPSYQNYPHEVNVLLQKGPVVEITCFAAIQGTHPFRSFPLLNAMLENHDRLSRSGKYRGFTRILSATPDHAKVYRKLNAAEFIGAAKELSGVNNTTGVLMEITSRDRMPCKIPVMDQIGHLSWSQQVFPHGKSVLPVLEPVFQALKMKCPAEVKCRPPGLGLRLLEHLLFGKGCVLLFPAF